VIMFRLRKDDLSIYESANACPYLCRCAAAFHDMIQSLHRESPALVSPPGPGRERVPISVYSSSDAAGKAVAVQIAQLIRDKADRGQKAVIGLATGSTPQGMYEELVRLHHEEQLSFRNVITFNLDEYWPMEPDALQSYRRFMQEYLFDHIDIDPGSSHVPDGRCEREDVHAMCERYERMICEAGGIDIQVLGVGRTGHIGFNEPGSPRDSRTRLVTLDRITRMDAASDFFGERNVPRKAITMGVGTILDAKQILLLAFGEHKAAIVKRATEGEVTPTVAASFLQQHPSARLVLDAAAAAELTRFKTPWLLGPIEEFDQSWDTATTRRAVIWLSLTVGKPILKLTDQDYNEHGLQELLAARGEAYDLNIEVFRTLQRTITGWPGGKPPPPPPLPPPAPLPPPEVQATRTPRANSQVFPKKIVIFSPHPDDDVISMGGTLIRLCEQGHEVHVAYQTSGNIAVWDESALRHVDFMREFAHAFGPQASCQTDALEDRIESFLARKAPGEIDPPELQRVKALIRRTEARAAARYSGVDTDHIHFLDLPFYETGRVRKKPISEDDLRITMDLLERVQPHQVYAAGDLSDPHGTHRQCLTIVMESLKRLRGREWMNHCAVWLYRGAWQEWEPHEIDMAVPLSPDEVIRKRMAIFKHESQKDLALFPGPSDPREFWQRAEDRNRQTARTYDKFGLAEYEAMEGFLRWADARAG
jgi:glucosamine-6-phosphate deaminase